LTGHASPERIANMKSISTSLAALIAIIGISSSAFGQEPINPADTDAKKAHDKLPADQPQVAATASASAMTTPASQMNEAEMMKQMMEMSKLNENHKLLASMVGSWSYTIKMWMNPDPNAKPQESKGTAVRKSLWDGRYFVFDVTGKMQMPESDGKMKEMMFKGMSIEGYDNVKNKFVSTWIDNMGTGIVMAEGTYDPATKTLTYMSEFEPMPGMKQQIREVVKIVDKDHHIFEWYEDRAGQEAKTMENSYTRKK
jgi:hypothetical protein